MMENSSKNADLHTHSIISDGQLSVGLLVKEIEKNNIKYLSITDHENTNQTKQYQKITRYYNTEIEFIPGIEISTKHFDQEIHIVAYYHPSISDKIENIVTPLRENKKHRVLKIIEILREIGIHFPTYFITNGEKTFNRVNIARFIYSNLEFNNVEEVFKKYLNDSKININVEYPSTEDIIIKLNSIGCLTGIAHPDFLKDKNKIEYIKHLTKVGIKGIEAFHPLIDKNLSQDLLNFCQENNLIVLGGSDFHGYDTKRKVIGQHKTFSYSAEAIIKYINS